MQRIGTPVVPTGDADVAADAFADFVVVSLIQLARQERVGDGGARGADQIEHAAPDLRNHGVRRREAADADDRPRGQRLDEIDDGFVAALLGETRRSAIRGAGIQLYVPQIGDFGEFGNDFVRFGFGMGAGAAAQFLEADAQSDAAIGADRILHHLQRLPRQTATVRDAAAIGVRAFIEAGQQEFVQQVSHAGVDVDDIETSAAGAQRGVTVPA